MSANISDRAWSIALKNEALASEFVDQYAGEGIQLREGGKRYKGSLSLILAHRDDFEQASLLGLARGAEKWIPGNGALSTYAAYYVHEELNKETKSHRAAEERSSKPPPTRPSSGKKEKMKDLADGVHAPSAEDQSIAQDPGTNGLHTKGRTVGGKPSAASPSAPDARRTEAGASRHAAQRPGESVPQRRSSRSPSATQSKAGPQVSFNSVEGALRRVSTLLEVQLEELSPEHLTTATAIVRFLFRDLAPLLHNDALALTGQIIRTESELSEETRRAGNALRMRALRANRKRFDELRRTLDD